MIDEAEMERKRIVLAKAVQKFLFADIESALDLLRPEEFEALAERFEYLRQPDIDFSLFRSDLALLRDEIF